MSSGHPATLGRQAAPQAPSTRSQLNGILFVALFAAAVIRIASLPAIAGLGVSPLIIGIVAGAIYGNALRDGMPESWAAGIHFAARELLRIAVALYAFLRFDRTTPHRQAAYFLLAQ